MGPTKRMFSPRAIHSPRASSAICCAPARRTCRSRSASKPLVSAAGLSFGALLIWVRTLVEARDAKELGRYMRRLERVDAVIIDEVGFVPFDRQGGELLFNVFASRHGRRSIIVTSNLAFSEWPRVFGGDEKLTTALLDRLAEHATLLATKGKSYRMRNRASPDGSKPKA